MQKMPGSGQELSSFVLEEIENDENTQAKLDDQTLTERERDIINHGISELKKTIISEEKLTRLLFANILTWFQDERTKQEAAEELKASSGEKKETDQKSTLTAEDLRPFSGKDSSC
jgi:hypothetical protein